MKYTYEQVKEVTEALVAEKKVALHKRLQILLWRMRGKGEREVIALSGASHSTIWRICKQYNENGLGGLSYKHGGGNRKLSFEQEAEALQRLESGARNGQFVRTAELQAEFESNTGVSYEPAVFVRLLARHGWRKVTPRGRHPKAADEAACEAAKKLTLR